MAQRLAFRSAILPSLGAALVVALVALLLGIVAGGRGMLLRTGLAVGWSDAVQLVWVVIITLVVVLVAVMLYRVYVSEEGLRCYTFWGTYRTIRWGEIDSVRPINLGLRYLRVKSSQRGSVVWVPLFLADMPRFRAAVREFAGEGHILSRALT